jgi:hypothetical protein
MKRLLLCAAILFACSTTFALIEDGKFYRGDANSDTWVTIADASYITNWLFLAGPPPICYDAADVNDDGQHGVEDSVFLLNFLFDFGPPPPAPGPWVCGVDPTEDNFEDCVEDICE